MPNVLPPEFSDLEPFAAWAVHGEKARYEKRLASTMDELQEFYDAAFARIDEALAYLERFAVEDLSEEGKRLLWLYCALCTVAFPVEAWRQPRVPDSGPSSIDAVSEPLV